MDEFEGYRIFHAPTLEALEATTRAVQADGYVLEFAGGPFRAKRVNKEGNWRGCWCQAVDVRKKKQRDYVTGKM